MVVATDAGAGKIAGHFAKRLGLPMAVIDKRRLDDTEKAQSTALIGDVRGKEAIIYDDEIATGGSIQEAARILRNFGAKRVRVGVTHAVLSGPALDRLKSAELDELVVTDTVPMTEANAKGAAQPEGAVDGQAVRRRHRAHPRGPQRQRHRRGVGVRALSQASLRNLRKFSRQRFAVSMGEKRLPSCSIRHLWISRQGKVTAAGSRRPSLEWKCRSGRRWRSVLGGAAADRAAACPWRPDQGKPAAHRAF